MALCTATCGSKYVWKNSLIIIWRIPRVKFRWRNHSKSMHFTKLCWFATLNEKIATIWKRIIHLFRPPKLSIFKQSFTSLTHWKFKTRDLTFWRMLEKEKKNKVNACNFFSPPKKSIMLLFFLRRTSGVFCCWVVTNLLKVFGMDHLRWIFFFCRSLANQILFNS